ncbi:MAG: trehalose-phosphatase [Deltaproteobacteria bacterium]|nr:trehalose-phosphatase [Deltaproteobacteria bacterium]
MRNILSHANLEILEQFAWSNVLLAFDYDGTLAPIVENPEHADMRKTTRRLLGELARIYPCVVISGRAQADVNRWLQGVGIEDAIGNHGVEPWKATTRMRDDVRTWLPVLHGALAHLKGVTIEDKDFSLAIHYRHSREKKKARRAILEAASRLGDVRIIGGKQVINLVPKGAPHKGMALERERERLGCDTAIYVGDDETDEDVFALDEPGRLLTIRVGAKRGSAASYYIPRQAEVDELLRVLIGTRRKAEQRRRVGR